MAVGANIAACEDMRQGTLNFRMDEFHGFKITISIQRNHRKARNKENLGSFVHSSRNAKTPSDRQNSHIAEQQDYSTRVHDGLRTRSTIAPSGYDWSSASHSGAQAVPSIAHEMLKFPVTRGTVTLQSSRIMILECTMVSGLGARQLVNDQVTEEKIQVAIHPEYPKQTIAIGSTLTEEGRKELWGLLRRCLPVRQKKRGQAPERNKAIYEEVEKLVNTGYHQIKMAKEDKKKTAFITSQGIFCYSKTPFELKNARATYQRLVDKAFQKQIGRNLEVYVDNLVIKAHRAINDSPDTPMEEKEELPDPLILFTDRSSCVNGSRAGLMLTNPEGVEFTYAKSLTFYGTLLTI
nr:reverse transcriptase domain-containing protein [Tanacetum cinerariifolium]